MAQKGAAWLIFAAGVRKERHFYHARKPGAFI